MEQTPEKTVAVKITPSMLKAGEEVVFADARDFLALGLEGPAGNYHFNIVGPRWYRRTLRTSRYLKSPPR